MATAPRRQSQTAVIPWYTSRYEAKPPNLQPAGMAIALLAGGQSGPVSIAVQGERVNGRYDILIGE